MDSIFYFFSRILLGLIVFPILAIIGMFAYEVMGWIGVVIMVCVCIYSIMQGFKEEDSANNRKNNYQNGADNDDWLYYHFTKED